MSKAKVLVLGGLRDDALTELKEVCDITCWTCWTSPR